MLEYIESMHAAPPTMPVPDPYNPMITKRPRKEKPDDMADIYRYLISKDPTLLTSKSALLIFKLDDKGLNEELIRILQTNRPTVLVQLYREILGNKPVHFTNNSFGLNPDLTSTNRPSALQDRTGPFYCKYIRRLHNLCTNAILVIYSTELIDLNAHVNNYTSKICVI